MRLRRRSVGRRRRFLGRIAWLPSGFGRASGALNLSVVPGFVWWDAEARLTGLKSRGLAVRQYDLPDKSVKYSSRRGALDYTEQGCDVS